MERMLSKIKDAVNEFLDDNETVSDEKWKAAIQKCVNETIVEVREKKFKFAMEKHNAKSANARNQTARDSIVNSPSSKLSASNSQAVSLNPTIYAAVVSSASQSDASRPQQQIHPIMSGTGVSTSNAADQTLDNAPQSTRKRRGYGTDRVEKFPLECTVNGCQLRFKNNDALQTHLNEYQHETQ